MKTKECVIYARYSSHGQREESLDAQERACRAYAEEHGYEVVEVYQDAAKSGKTDKRSGYSAMMQKVASREIQYILVHKYDRLSRNQSEAVAILHTLKKMGAKVIAVEMPYDDTPAGEMAAEFSFIYAAYESEKIGREALKGQIENAYAGKHTGGKPPFGYTVNSDKNLIIVPKEADIVRKIFDLYNSGLSMASVAEKVNQMGATTRQGKPFTRYSVRDILHNEKYTGTYIFRYNKDKAPVKSNQYDGEVRVPGGCPQIISLEAFEKAKRRRNGGTDETAHSA